MDEKKIDTRAGNRAGQGPERGGGGAVSVLGDALFRKVGEAALRELMHVNGSGECSACMFQSIPGEHGEGSADCVLGLDVPGKVNNKPGPDCPMYEEAKP